jgi:hypothetical protein
MGKNRPRWLWCLGVAALVGLLGGGYEAAAQLNLLDQKYDRSWGDYTWGGYGGSREASRLGREDLIAREGYCPTGGCVLRLEQVQVLPPTARGGDHLSLVATYSVLTPEQIALPITITREIFFQGKSLGRTKSTETRQLNGTWSQEMDFKLPANASPGTYTLFTKVSTGYSQEQKTVDFQVY